MMTFHTAFVVCRCKRLQAAQLELGSTLPTRLRSIQVQFLLVSSSGTSLPAISLDWTMQGQLHGYP